MKNLSLKHKLYVAYFVLAWPLLAINDNAPLWAILLVVLNFINAGRLMLQIKTSKETNKLEKR